MPKARKAANAGYRWSDRGSIMRVPWVPSGVLLSRMAWLRDISEGTDGKQYEVRQHQFIKQLNNEFGI